MNVVLWIIAVVLAFAFFVAGLTKVSQPKEKLAASGMGYVEHFSPNTVKAIGVLEILAALGLTLPAALGVATALVPVAATGLVLLMVGAVITHARRREPQMIVVNVVLLAFAAVVAWGRFGPYSF